MVEKLFKLEKNDKNIKLMNKIENGIFMKNLSLKSSQISYQKKVQQKFYIVLNFIKKFWIIYLII
jgi:hypothetical protein